MQFAGLDKRGDGCPVLRPLIVAGEERVLSIEHNRAVILPISGRMLLSTIAGIRCTGKARVAFRLNGAQRASSCTSSWDRAS